jgi:hypothetical protein
MWEEAGLTAESILAATASGQLSLDFLESPGWEFPPRLDRTYRQLAEERGCRSDSYRRSSDRWGGAAARGASRSVARRRRDVPFPQASRHP